MQTDLSPSTAATAEATTTDELTLLVFAGDLDKAIGAFIIANGASAMDTKVTMFFAFWGINILRKDQAPTVKKDLISRMFGWMMPQGANRLALSKMNMMGMGTTMMKQVMHKKNVLSLPKLIEFAQADENIRLVACEMSMDVMGIKREELLDGVEIGGVASFVASATTPQSKGVISFT